MKTKAIIGKATTVIQNETIIQKTINIPFLIILHISLTTISIPKTTPNISYTFVINFKIHIKNLEIQGNQGFIT